MMQDDEDCRSVADVKQPVLCRVEMRRCGADVEV